MLHYGLFIIIIITKIHGSKGEGVHFWATEVIFSSKMISECFLCRFYPLCHEYDLWISLFTNDFNFLGFKYFRRKLFMININPLNLINAQSVSIF